MSKPRIRLHCTSHRGIYLRWWAEVENMTTGRGTLPYVLHIVQSWLASRATAK
jgi:hypothetical protein